MTHPLTDDMVHSISEFDKTYAHNMRAAADWQLEQVEKKVETTLSAWRRCSPNFHGDTCNHIEDFFHYVMQAMRPQQQENQ